jgi:hypothetical protein
VDLKSFEYLSLSAVGLISAVFYISRGRLYLYTFLSAVILGAFAISGHTLASTPEYFLTLVGVIFYFYGLLIVRIMLKRSVSLQLLARIAASDRRNLTLNPEIKGRFDDLVTYRLARTDQNQVCHLTPFGKMVSTLVRVLYIILRIQK